jgi:hypothetical protein
MFERAYASGAVNDFKQRILDNLLRIQQETGMAQLAFPVGVFLVLDHENGGDQTGAELIRRFNFIDVESRNVIDFFFLGWKRSKSTPTQLTFDLTAFQCCREAFQKVGVTAFGGYADLLLFDAILSNGRAVLDFEHALHVDLAEAVASKRITKVGKFVEELTLAASKVRGETCSDIGLVYRISDQLGLAVAKKSALDFVLNKWGKIIGGGSLLPLATRRVGPKVDLAKV